MPHEFGRPLEIISPSRAQKHGSEEERWDHEAVARDICQLGNYETILHTFSKKEHGGLLEEAMERTKKRSEAILGDNKKLLMSGDWEMLTILELFDHETFEHCLRTYQIAHQKIQSLGPVGEYLRQEIKKEGLVPWDIEHACLLHDMGKIILTPKPAILNNYLTDTHWRTFFEQFCHNSFSPEVAKKKIADYATTLASQPHLRPKDLTPLAVALSKEENTSLQRRGIDTNQSLGALIATHQDVSVEIATRYFPGSPILPLIGNHHEKAVGREETRPISKEVVQVSALLATLRLADVFDALRSDRPYKKAFPIFRTLSILVEETNHGLMNHELAKLWINDELKDFDIDTYLKQVGSDENTDCQDVMRFLDRPYHASAQKSCVKYSCFPPSKNSGLPEF